MDLVHYTYGPLGTAVVTGTAAAAMATPAVFTP